MSNRQRIAGAETDLRQVRERFGKADLVASTLGALTAIGALVFLLALIAAGGGNISVALNQIDLEGALTDYDAIATAIGVVVVFVAFLAGGFATGRMARYHGGANGVGAALWVLLVMGILAALGAWVGPEYNAFNQAYLPNWFAQVDVDEVTVQAIVAALGGAVAMIAGGYFGGRLGELYHREPDAAIAEAARDRSGAHTR